MQLQFHAQATDTPDHENSGGWLRLPQAAPKFLSGSTLFCSELEQLKVLKSDKKE